jgi:hypothetical protein
MLTKSTVTHFYFSHDEMQIFLLFLLTHIWMDKRVRVFQSRNSLTPRPRELVAGTPPCQEQSSQTHLAYKTPTLTPTHSACKTPTLTPTHLAYKTATQTHSTNKSILTFYSTTASGSSVCWRFIWRECKREKGRMREGG